MHQSIGTRLDNLRRAPRCGATTRVGAPCQCPAMRGRKRCRLHGGISPGAPRGAQNGNFRDGTWTAEGSRNAGGFGRLFGPSASLKTHHDNKKQYSEWSGCQCRALPSRTSQVAAHQRGSGESTPARRRDQGLVGEAQEGTRHEFERFRQFVIGPIASSGPATIWRHLGNRRECGEVQAFVFNVFGCLDNLVWIWVEERNVKNPKDGKDLPPGFVGLRPKNEIVMASLDVDVRKYLNSGDRWFEYLENYRHALAHQIPLYIPPYGPRPGHEGRCRELEVALAELHGDLEALRRERDQLILFKPYIMGSFTGGAKPMPFHWQMLCDFKTIEAISAKMLDAIAVPA